EGASPPTLQSSSSPGSPRGMATAPPLRTPDSRMPMRASSGRKSLAAVVQPALHSPAVLDLRALIPDVIAVPARRLRSPVARAAHRRARRRYRAWPAELARTVDVELRRLQVGLYGSGKEDLRSARRVVELHIIGM